MTEVSKSVKCIIANYSFYVEGVLHVERAFVGVQAGSRGQLCSGESSYMIAPHGVN